MNDLVEVAKIGKTVGLKGDLKLHNRSDFPEQFKKKAKFLTQNKEILEIKTISKDKNLVCFLGFEDINEAQKLTNLTLYVSKEETRKNCKLEKDEFFWFDIIGLNIIEDELNLGKVIDIQTIANDDLLYIQTEQNLAKKGFSKNFYIPYKDNFIKEVSLDDEKIQVKNSFAILENS